MIFVSDTIRSWQLEVQNVMHAVPVRSTWVHVAIDFTGPISPISSSGNRYVLTLTDYFSKWVEAVPKETKETFGVSNILFKV